MTPIEEVINKKQQIIKTIEKILDDFEEDTGARIAEVSLSILRPGNKPAIRITLKEI